MSKLKKGDNPCPYIGEMVPDEKGKVTIPPEKYTIAVAPLDVKNNGMKLTGVDKYTFKEIDGKIYRISERGIEYPPISKEQYEELKKLHKEYFSENKKEDNKER